MAGLWRGLRPVVRHGIEVGDERRDGARGADVFADAERAHAALVLAYGAQPRFSHLMEAKLDRNTRTVLVSAIANCWLGLRLECLGATLAALAALLAFVHQAQPAAAGGELDGGAAAARVRAALDGAEPLDAVLQPRGRRAQPRPPATRTRTPQRRVSRALQSSERTPGGCV